MGRTYLLVAACAALLSLAIEVGVAPRANADLIFDQTVDLATDDGLHSDFNPLSGQQLADDFQLEPGASTITDIHWWGLYPSLDPNPPATDDFTIRIFGDDGGTPEIDPLDELDFGTVHRVDTGIVTVGGSRKLFFYTVEISPLALGSNTTYWLSIVNDTTTLRPLGFWAWSSDFPDSAGNAANRFGDGTAWGDVGFTTLGFQLTNDALTVPEPATWVLFAAGVAGLGLLVRRCLVHQRWQQFI